MKLTWKERVLTALLGATAALAITVFILILVETTNVRLPTDTKVHPDPEQGRLGWAVVHQAPCPPDPGVITSLGSCSTRGPPTRPSLCIGGRQTRRMTQALSARPWPARWKVSGLSVKGGWCGERPPTAWLGFSAG